MMKPSNTTPYNVILATLVATSLSACNLLETKTQVAEDQYQPAPIQQSADLYYVVRRGDLLGTIAEKLTGQRSNWEAIAKANGVTDPRKLRVGQRLVIPGYLMPPTISTNVGNTVPSAVALQSVDRTGANSAHATVTIDDVGPDAADVVVKKANPNKRFVLTPLGEETETTHANLNGHNYIKVVGTYFPKVVYRSPQLDAQLLMRVAPGTTFPLEKLDNGWYRVSTDQGIGFLRVEDGQPTRLDG